MNIGAHVQVPPLGDQLRLYMNFMEKLAAFYKENFLQPSPEERAMVPLLWNTMNAHYPRLKPENKRHQTELLSSIYNDIAYYALGNASVPIIDFHTLMLKGLPQSTYDGMHSSLHVDILKNQMILNFVCNSGTFNTNFLLGEPYYNKLRGL